MQASKKRKFSRSPCLSRRISPCGRSPARQEIPHPPAQAPPASPNVPPPQAESASPEWAPGSSECAPAVSSYRDSSRPRATSASSIGDTRGTPPVARRADAAPQAPLYKECPLTPPVRCPEENTQAPTTPAPPPHAPPPPPPHPHTAHATRHN